MATRIPEVFGTGSEGLTFNLDYFDYAAGAGYKRYYLAGAYDSVGKKYFLTTNSSLYSDLENSYSSGDADLDFDLTFNNPATIAAADATIDYSVWVSASNISIVWNIYHVSTGAVETLLGTVTNHTFSNGGNAWAKQCVKLTLTKKSFSIGEKLRVNAIVNASGVVEKLQFDPSGRYTNAENATGATIGSTACVNVPFEVDL